MLATKLGHDGIHLGFRLLGLNARLESSDSVEVMRSSTSRVSLKREGRPYINAVAKRQRAVVIAWMLGARRHHADHRVGLQIQSDLSANGVGISTESLTPEPIAQNDLQSIAWDFCLLVELPSQSWLEAQHMKVAGGNFEPVEPHRVAGTRELKISARVSSQRLKGRIASAEVMKIPGVQRELRKSIVGEKDPHQPVRLRVGKRLQ